MPILLTEHIVFGICPVGAFYYPFCIYICHGLKIRVFYFFYISQTLQMNQISFMAFLLNAVL